jgi:hypothetical protein
MSAHAPSLIKQLSRKRRIVLVNPFRSFGLVRKWAWMLCAALLLGWFGALLGAHVGKRTFRSNSGAFMLIGLPGGISHVGGWPPSGASYKPLVKGLGRFGSMEAQAKIARSPEEPTTSGHPLRQRLETAPGRTAQGSDRWR